MCRVALGALLALGLAGAAAAEDDFAWRQVEIGAGRALWVAAEDLESLGESGEGVRSIHVLWTHPTQRNLPPRTRYVFSEYTFDCRAAGVREDIRAFDSHDQPLAEIGDREEQEVNLRSPVGALFAMACQGAAYEDGLELGSAREVLDYEASGRGRQSPSRPPNRWNQGPGQPDDEPVEPADPDRN